MDNFKARFAPTLDYVFLFLALTGLWTSAMNIAEFFTIPEHSVLAATRDDLLTIVFFDVTFCAIGFCYMLWRNGWQFRLIAFVGIVGLWTLIFLEELFARSRTSQANDFEKLGEIIATTGLSAASGLCAWMWLPRQQQLEPSPFTYAANRRGKIFG